MILDRILEEKAREARRLTGRASSLAAQAAQAPEVRDFAAALASDEGLSLVAEFKRRSPSAGALAAAADPAEVAAAYEAAGAAALSVLTDAPHFGGSLDDLAAARAACALPVLRKDFLVDPVQAVEARASGADAVLLIVRALPGEALSELMAAARELGMEALVEVHDAEELERALAADARVVGVNARDLATFRVDVDAALELIAEVPPDRVAVAESGIGGRQDAALAARAGADAALVGGWLMRHGAERARELVGLPRKPRDAAAFGGGG